MWQRIRRRASCSTALNRPVCSAFVHHESATATSPRRSATTPRFSIGRGKVAQAPLAEVMQYQSQLKSVTGGQGSFSMEFAHYDVMPGNIQQEVISKAQLHEEEEE